MVLVAGLGTIWKVEFSTCITNTSRDFDRNWTSVVVITERQYVVLVYRHKSRY